MEPPVPEMQPWALAPELELAPALAEQRNRLLADIANSRLATQEQRVARILERYPETRESDIALCLRYWRTFQAETIERWDPLELEILFELDRMDTLGRARRFIQNDLRLFRGMEDTRKAREAIQREFHEYIAAHRDTLPEIRFYLDETGNEGDKTYTGVAVCASSTGSSMKSTTRPWSSGGTDKAGRRQFTSQKQEPTRSIGRLPFSNNSRSADPECCSWVTPFPRVAGHKKPCFRCSSS
jgi:hypothetical protein